jgi:hypothetical protein
MACYFDVNVDFAVHVNNDITPHNFFFWIRCWNQEPSAPAAGGTPWKGRLRSHHSTPQSLPTRSRPSRAKNQEEEDDVQMLKKQASPKKTGSTGTGRKAGGAQRPKALRLQSLRNTGRDPENPIVIDDEVNEVGAVSFPCNLNICYT